MRFTVIEMAEACHEMNRIVQMKTGEEVNPHWDELSQDMKDSAADGVQKAIEGYTPEQLHDNWCDFKIKQGWEYGEIKNPLTKTHPCLVAYEDLPEEQKIKDDIFSETVATLWAVGGAGHDIEVDN